MAVARRKEMTASEALQNILAYWLYFLALLPVVAVVAWWLDDWYNGFKGDPDWWEWPGLPPDGAHYWKEYEEEDEEAEEKQEEQQEEEPTGAIEWSVEYHDNGTKTKQL